MSDTPRTEAALAESRKYAGPTIVLERERIMHDLCRQLERELAVARRRLTEWELWEQEDVREA